jgi:hypothetical protein
MTQQVSIVPRNTSRVGFLTLQPQFISPGGWKPRQPSPSRPASTPEACAGAQAGPSR